MSEIINDLTSVGINLVTNRNKEKLRPGVASKVNESAIAHLEVVWKKEAELIASAKRRKSPLTTPTPLTEIVERYESEQSAKEDTTNAAEEVVENDGENTEGEVTKPETPKEPSLKDRLIGPLEAGLLHVCLLHVVTNSLSGHQSDLQRKTFSSPTKAKA